MCGIAGILSLNPSSISLERLQKMAAVIAHRGPDGEKFWINNNVTTGFAHRRLTIIDTSESASQPMHFLDRYTIVFNGEIYNYIELREILKNQGYHFRTQSDTEVLLAAYDCYREKCLQYFDGMFAFAIWDEKEQILFAARDRFGEKPFYYTFDEKQFLFASERKSLWAAGINKKINEPLLLNYLAFGITDIPIDKTITYYQDVFSLPPANFITCSIASNRVNPENDYEFSMSNYWDIDKEAKIKITRDEAIEKFRELFSISIKRRLRSDVPLGASLSGGLDSSSIVAEICNQVASDNKLETFSATFPGFKKDESVYIQQLAEKFNIKNTSIEPTGDDLIKNFETLCYYHEEPFSSASIYAQYKVFETAAKNNIKVLLDGQGADEILGGYQKYIHWYLQELLKSSTKNYFLEKRALKKNKIDFSWGWRNCLAAWFPGQAAFQLEKREAKKLMHLDELADEFRNEYFDRQSIFKPLVFKLNDILYFNAKQSGLEELLRYADRNSMAHGREVRLPFLNHELAQFIFSLPAQYKIHDGWTKWLLRSAMQAELPSTITWRKDKIGYEPPQKEWMENKSLQEYIHEAKKKLVEERILKPDVLSKKIQPKDAHAAENYDWRYLIAATCMTK
ncbi:MAG: asparagine synthase (glutamine-hydrolyzing) [Bacteroidetes bacterium]|nr:asparagine synthase (glutamine-hydrolyzing) [Bacteroidota bacterium]